MTSRVIEPGNDRIQDAVNIAWRFGQIDGDHHRVWVIDQMVRALIGNEAEYKAWVSNYENNGEYEWDVGIAP